MLKRFSLLVLCLGILLIYYGQVYATISGEEAPPPKTGEKSAVVINKWRGAWYSEIANGVMFISENNGYIDIYGKDDSSVYSCIGVLTGDSVECHGQGVDIEGSFFLYNSLLTNKDNGQNIDEKWDVLVPDRKIGGTTTYKKKNLSGENRKETQKKPEADKPQGKHAM